MSKKTSDVVFNIVFLIGWSLFLLLILRVLEERKGAELPLWQSLAVIFGIYLIFSLAMSAVPWLAAKWYGVEIRPRKKKKKNRRSKEQRDRAAP